MSGECIAERVLGSHLYVHVKHKAGAKRHYKCGICGAEAELTRMKSTKERARSPRRRLTQIALADDYWVKETRTALDRAQEADICELVNLVRTDPKFGVLDTSHVGQEDGRWWLMRVLGRHIFDGEFERTVLAQSPDANVIDKLYTEALAAEEHGVLAAIASCCATPLRILTEMREKGLVPDQALAANPSIPVGWFSDFAASEAPEVHVALQVTLVPPWPSWRPWRPVPRQIVTSCMPCPGIRSAP